MDQPYSVWADLLAKFHASSDLIQALWLIAVPATVLGVAYLVLRAIRDILALLPRWAGDRGRLVYGVYQDVSRQWMVYSLGRDVREVDWADPPGELIGWGDGVPGNRPSPHRHGRA
jgi:hypothetical protein